MPNNLHPVFQQALAPFMPPPPPEFIQAIRDKLDEEYACGMDSVGEGYDEDDTDEGDCDE